jgi:hypothetical protein
VELATKLPERLNPVQDQKCNKHSLRALVRPATVPGSPHATPSSWRCAIPGNCRTCRARPSACSRPPRGHVFSELSRERNEWPRPRFPHRLRLVDWLSNLIEGDFVFEMLTPSPSAPSRKSITRSTDRICFVPGASRCIERRWMMNCSVRSSMRRIASSRSFTALKLKMVQAWFPGCVQSSGKIRSLPEAILGASVPGNSARDVQLAADSIRISLLGEPSFGTIELSARCQVGTHTIRLGIVAEVSEPWTALST